MSNAKPKRARFTVRASLGLWTRRLAVRERLLKHARLRHEIHPTKATAANLEKRKGQVQKAREMVKRRDLQVNPLRVRALREARELVGVMEQGGNNQGRRVMEIIRANGGTGPEPWCGDFVAYCYRRAGSKAVDRRWASVYFLGTLRLVVKTKSPLPGDIVRYSFSHTGLFVRWTNRGRGEFEAVEGNTGATGAVSDSATGGDGVYLKRRNLSQVDDFRRVRI